MKPYARLRRGGIDLPYDLDQRLLSLEVTDEAEDKSDALSFEVDARPEGASPFPLPPIGVELSCLLSDGIGQLRDMGRYIIDSASLSYGTLSVKCHAANLVESYRTPRFQSHHGSTLGEMVQAAAARHGYEPVIDPELGAIEIPHQDQFSESDMSFLTRLAQKFDGVARPMDGRLVLARRGTGQEVNGAAFDIITIKPKDCIGGESAFTFDYSGREEGGAAGGISGTETAREPGGYRAHFYDRAAGVKDFVEVGKAPFCDLRQTEVSRAAAEAAAASQLNQKTRGAGSFSVKVLGNPDIRAECLLKLSGFNPGIPTLWRIKTATHNLQGGYETGLTCELYKGASGGEPTSGNTASIGKQENVPGRAKKTAGKSKYGWSAPYVEG